MAFAAEEPNGFLVALTGPAGCTMYDASDGEPCAIGERAGERYGLAGGIAAAAGFFIGVAISAPTGFSMTLAAPTGFFVSLFATIADPAGFLMIISATVGGPIRFFRSGFLTAEPAGS